MSRKRWRSPCGRRIARGKGLPSPLVDHSIASGTICGLAMDSFHVAAPVGQITITGLHGVGLIRAHLLHHSGPCGESGAAGFESATHSAPVQRARSAIVGAAHCRLSAGRLGRGREPHQIDLRRRTRCWLVSRSPAGGPQVT